MNKYLMKREFKIVFAPNNKIADEAHQLVKELFDTEGALITNESLLEDFLDSGENEISIEKIREMLTERIADRFGVVIPEILDGETRIYKVVGLIREKQDKLFTHEADIEKKSAS